VTLRGQMTPSGVIRSEMSIVCLSENSVTDRTGPSFGRTPRRAGPLIGPVALTIRQQATRPPASTTHHGDGRAMTCSVRCSLHTPGDHAPARFMSSAIECGCPVGRNADDRPQSIWVRRFVAVVVVGARIQPRPRRRTARRCRVMPRIAGSCRPARPTDGAT